MTKKDYISLVNEFGLDYDADTTSAYFNGFPICGYRSCLSSAADWKANSLIIFEKYTEQTNEYGHYTGIYDGKSAHSVKEARQLIVNQIMFIKNLQVSTRLENMKEDFR